MSKQSNINGVFYLHTEPIEKGYNIGHRATIAVVRIKDGLLWGLAICSHRDNFCKQTGREIALDRLRDGFGIVPNNGYFERFDSEGDMLLDFSVNVAQSVQKNWGKYKMRIAAFKEPFDEEPEEPIAGLTQSLYLALKANAEQTLKGSIAGDIFANSTATV